MDEMKTRTGIYTSVRCILQTLTFPRRLDCDSQPRLSHRLHNSTATSNNAQSSHSYFPTLGFERLGSPDPSQLQWDYPRGSGSSVDLFRGELFCQGESRARLTLTSITLLRSSCVPTSSPLAELEMTAPPSCLPLSDVPRIR